MVLIWLVFISIFCVVLNFEAVGHVACHDICCPFLGNEMNEIQMKVCGIGLDRRAYITQVQ